MRYSRKLGSLLVALALAGCTDADNHPGPPVAAKETLVYFGTHGDKPGEEIFGAWFDERTGTLRGIGSVADIFRPTWLVAHPDKPILFSVSESGNDGKSEGRIVSFLVDRSTGKLQQISDAGAGGGGTTHLDFDRRSSSIVAANFGSGSATVLPVSAEGRLGTVAGIGQDAGTGPKPRQSKPHAHAVAVDPTGRYVLVPDLGADRTFIYRLDPRTRALRPAGQPFVQAPAGSGPRHIVFSPDGRFAYVDTELSAQIIVYRWHADVGRLEQVQLIDAAAAGSAGERSAAEIALTRDGEFLYVSLREGEDSVVAYRRDKTSGKLTEIQRVSTGRKPWSFSLSPREKWLLVTEEADNRISVFKRDTITGFLSATGSELAIPRPVNVTFVR